MKNYKVTATKSDGTEVSDVFTEPTEGAARKSFKECYRHGSYTITAVELIAENISATKDQERAALEAIRKMVAELGPDSYIATTFEGCFEIAEQNIDNDFADSMAGRVQVEHDRATAAEEARDEANQRAELLARKMEGMEVGLDNAIKKQAELRSTAASLRDTASEQARIASDEKQRANAAEAFVIKLKAELYDYMTQSRK